MDLEDRVKRKTCKLKHVWRCSFKAEHFEARLQKSGIVFDDWSSRRRRFPEWRMRAQSKYYHYERFQIREAVIRRFVRLFVPT